MGVIFSHLVDGIILKLTIGWYYANIALFKFSLSSWEGPKERLGWHKMAGHTFQKIKWKLKIKFWKLVPSMSSMKYVVDKLHNRFTVSSHFVLTDKLSLTGREFCLLAHPCDESEIWNKANLYNTFSLCFRVCWNIPST